MVRAKFVCESIIVHNEGTENEAHQITLRAVYDDGKANKEWSKWTPAGQLMLTVTNPNVFGKFEVNKEYYLDLASVAEFGLVQYEHHGRLVTTRKETKGRHRELCLCWGCSKFNVDNPETKCKIADELYQLCVKHNITTPVLECPEKPIE